MVAAAPGLAQNADKTVIAQHADSSYSLITRDRPVIPGDPIILYLTGMGTPPYSPTVELGDFVVSGDQITFAGPTPGVPGLYQINLTVPLDLTASSDNPLVDITVTEKGTKSNAAKLPVGGAYTPPTPPASFAPR